MGREVPPVKPKSTPKLSELGTTSGRAYGCWPRLVGAVDLPARRDEATHE